MSEFSDLESRFNYLEEQFDALLTHLKLGIDWDHPKYKMKELTEEEVSECPSK